MKVNNTNCFVPGTQRKYRNGWKRTWMETGQSAIFLTYSNQCVSSEYQMAAPTATFDCVCVCTQYTKYDFVFLSIVSVSVTK